MQSYIGFFLDFHHLVGAAPASDLGLGGGDGGEASKFLLCVIFAPN